MTDRLPKAIDSVFLSHVTDRARNSPQGYDWKQTPEQTNPNAREKGKEKGNKRHARALHIQKPQLLSLFFNIAISFSQASKMEECLWVGFFFFLFNFLGLSLLER